MTGSMYLALLFVGPQQGPDVQQGVDSWGLLPLRGCLLDITQGTVVYVAAMALVTASLRQLHNVHLIPATLRQ